MRYCGLFLLKAEGGAKNYERDHPLPLAGRPITVIFVERKCYYSFQNGKINSTREIGFHLSLKVTQIFMILGYLNFSISVSPVV